MFIVIGYVIVILSVFGGFVMAGGHLAALLQPLEVLMIAGGAVGAFLVGNDIKVIKATMKTLPALFKSTKYDRSLYIELLLLLYRLLSKIRTDGLIAIESDVERPNESPLFSDYPLVLENHHVVEFLTDYLRLMVSGKADPFQIENLIDN